MMKRSKKIKIYAAMLFFVLFQIGFIVLAATLACETLNPLEWDNTIQFVALLAIPYLLQRWWVVTSQQIQRAEKSMEEIDELGGSLKEIMDQIRKHREEGE